MELRSGSFYRKRVALDNKTSVVYKKRKKEKIDDSKNDEVSKGLDKAPQMNQNAACSSMDSDENLLQKMDIDNTDSDANGSRLVSEEEMNFSDSNPTKDSDERKELSLDESLENVDMDSILDELVAEEVFEMEDSSDISDSDVRPGMSETSDQKPDDIDDESWRYLYSKTIDDTEECDNVEETKTVLRSVCNNVSIQPTSEATGTDISLIKNLKQATEAFDCWLSSRIAKKDIRKMSPPEEKSNDLNSHFKADGNDSKHPVNEKSSSGTNDETDALIRNEKAEVIVAVTDTEVEKLIHNTVAEIVKTQFSSLISTVDEEQKRLVECFKSSRCSTTKLREMAEEFHAAQKTFFSEFNYKPKVKTRTCGTNARLIITPVNDVSKEQPVKNSTNLKTISPTIVRPLVTIEAKPQAIIQPMIPRLLFLMPIEHPPPTVSNTVIQFTSLRAVTSQASSTGITISHPMTVSAPFVTSTPKTTTTGPQIKDFGTLRFLNRNIGVPTVTSPLNPPPIISPPNTPPSVVSSMPSSVTSPRPEPLPGEMQVLPVTNADEATAPPLQAPPPVPVTDVAPHSSESAIPSPPKVISNLGQPVQAVTISSALTNPSNTMVTGIVTASSVPSKTSENRHPAPLPCSPMYAFDEKKKEVPPKPAIKITKVEGRLVLSWNMRVTEEHAEVARYQLFGYMESPGPVSQLLWRKASEIKAQKLPTMACSIGAGIGAGRYHFSMRAVDVHERVGPFSKPASVFLRPVKKPSLQKGNTS